MCHLSDQSRTGAAHRLMARIWWSIEWFQKAISVDISRQANIELPRTTLISMCWRVAK